MGDQVSLIMHLVECVKKVGNLSDFSAYCYESFLQYIKRSVKMTYHILQQLYNFPVDIKLTQLDLRYIKGQIMSVVYLGYFSYKTPAMFIW